MLRLGEQNGISARDEAREKGQKTIAPHCSRIHSSHVAGPWCSSGLGQALEAKSRGARRNEMGSRWTAQLQFNCLCARPTTRAATVGGASLARFEFQFAGSFGERRRSPKEAAQCTGARTKWEPEALRLFVYSFKMRCKPSQLSECNNHISLRPLSLSPIGPFIWRRCPAPRAARANKSN